MFSSMMEAAMPKSVHITTPMPTSGELARRLRIPKARQRALAALAEEYVKKLEAEKKAAEPAIEREEKRTNASAAD